MAGGSPASTAPSRIPPTSAPRLGTAPNPRMMSINMRSTKSKSKWITPPGNGYTYTPGVSTPPVVDESFNDSW